MTKTKRQLIWLRVMSVIAMAFGLLTLREGGMVLYGNAAALSAAGNFVPFVLWFNFIAGFFYIICGIGLWLSRRWAVWLAIGLATSTALMFIAFGLHITLGGAYANRTIVAMSLRTTVWTVIALIAWLKLGSDSNQQELS